MNREQDAGKNQSKHISMELTADGARLVNLSLDGSRLVLTIEAELAGSQLRSVPPGGTAPGAHRTGHATEKSDTEFMYARTGMALSGGALDDTVVADTDSDVMRATTTGAKSFSGGFAAAPAPAPAQPATAPEATATATAQQTAENVYPSTETWNVAEPEEDTEEAPPVTDTATDMIAPATDTAGPERLAVSSTPHPASETQAALLPGITDTDMAMARAMQSPAAQRTQAQAPQVMPVQPEPELEPELPPLPEPRFMPEPPAIAEDSAAVGGPRHGEPQPGITFGMEPPAGTPAPANEGAPAAASAPAPAPVGEAAAPPIPDSLPHYGDNFATLPAGLDNSSPRTKTPEAAGTTVLIRYTCPKCKTQGMQAVDKVGTVVNCSNCGKAMRLVIKK